MDSGLSLPWPGFNPWLGNRDPASSAAQPKKKKENNERKRGGEREEKEECKLLTMTKYRTKCCMCACVLSCIQLFATPWTVASQGPLSVEFSRQEYRSGLPFPTP